eukprot:g18982.t1
MSMSLPGQIVLHDTEDDDASDGMAVTPIPTGRSDTFTARSGGDFGHTQSIGGGRKSIAEYHDPGRESRKSIKAQKDARMRGMSTDQLYTRRSGVAPPPVASASSVVIVLNMVVMSFEVQYQGLDTGQKIGFPLYNLPARDLWPGAEQVFTVTSWFFGVIFAVEMLGITRRARGQSRGVLSGQSRGHRVNRVNPPTTSLLRSRKFPFDFWNWFDAGMVALWILSETYFQSLDERIIRLARTARLFRLVKVIRMIHGFDSLYLMMTAMRGSLAVLFWSFILLLVAQIMIAFLLNQVLSATYLLDENKSISDRQEVFAYFGTCSRAILSMFELLVTIGFAVIGVINGVFMQETFKVAGSDDKIMMRQRERERKLHTKKMKVLFEHADESGDGILDMEEPSSTRHIHPEECSEPHSNVFVALRSSRDHFYWEGTKGSH